MFKKKTKEGKKKTDFVGLQVAGSTLNTAGNEASFGSSQDGIAMDVNCYRVILGFFLISNTVTFMETR